MKQKLFLFIFITAIAFPALAQQLPLNTCGIVCTYDASGNRLKRVYFCTMAPIRILPACNRMRQKLPKKFSLGYYYEGLYQRVNIIPIIVP